MTLEVRLLPLLQDNYGYLLHDSSTGETAVVDPSEAEPVLEALTSAGWRARHVLNTHHHRDHTAGNEAIAAAMDAEIVAPEAERQHIPSMTLGLRDGDSYRIGQSYLTAIATPGHTLGQLSYYAAEAGALFSGDTLFALGCGRIFEGTAAQMWQSLSRLRDLPNETLVYCGHEYTQSNCRFALSIEPHNEALQRRAAEIAERRAAGQPTVPSTIGEERQTNPFLRADHAAVQAALGMSGADPSAVFAELRRRKDMF